MNSTAQDQALQPTMSETFANGGRYNYACVFGIAALPGPCPLSD